MDSIIGISTYICDICDKIEECSYSKKNAEGFGGGSSSDSQKSLCKCKCLCVNIKARKGDKCYLSKEIWVLKVQFFPTFLEV